MRVLRAGAAARTVKEEAQTADILVRGVGGVGGCWGECAVDMARAIARRGQRGGRGGFPKAFGKNDPTTPTNRIRG